MCSRDVAFQVAILFKNMRHIAVAFLFASVLIYGQGGFTGPGRYEISNLKTGKLLDLDRSDKTTVIQFSPRGTENQRWDIEPAEGGFWYIRNAMNGKALQPIRDGSGRELIGARFDGSSDQQWRIQAGKDGNALIVARNGRTIDIPDGTSRDGVHVQIYEINGDSNQRFVFRRTGGFDRRRRLER